MGKLGKGKGHERSITPIGLAEAMAEQWDERILKEKPEAREQSLESG
jgi:hypothetical protein